MKTSKNSALLALLTLSFALMAQPVFAQQTASFNYAMGIRAEMMPIQITKDGAKINPIVYKDSTLKIDQYGNQVDYGMNESSVRGSKKWVGTNGNFSHENMEALKSPDGKVNQIVYAGNVNGYIHSSVMTLVQGTKVKSKTDCRSPAGAREVKDKDDLFCFTVTASICQNLYKAETTARIKKFKEKIEGCSNLASEARSLYQGIGASGTEYNKLMKQELDKLSASRAAKQTVALTGNPNSPADKEKYNRIEDLDFQNFGTFTNTLNSMDDMYNNCATIGLLDADYATPTTGKTDRQVVPSAGPASTKATQ